MSEVPSVLVGRFVPYAGRKISLMENAQQHLTAVPFAYRDK